jgi:hypothetical protein
MILNMLKTEVAKLRTAIESGQYDTRSLVGDVVLNMEGIMSSHESNNSDNTGRELRCGECNMVRNTARCPNCGSEKLVPL